MNKLNEENIKFYTVFDTVLVDLPSRSQEIVAKRFGIGEEKPLTLQAIGDEYGITRERVRQIVQSGLKSVRNAQENEEFLQAQELIITYIDNKKGIASVEDMVVTLGGDEKKEYGAIRFFVDGMHEIEVVNPKKYPVNEQVVALSNFDMEEWVMIHDNVKAILEEKQKVYTSNRLQEKINNDFEIDHKQLENYLIISSEIGKNPFDKWGFYEWDDISPRGVREKALLIMKEKKEPMHFREVAQAIDDYGLGKKGRKSHPQTVHNELIRDDNFVLVGRGVYALHNDDYVSGTVKDVIENILENSEMPLTSEEIVERVLENRYVKPSTVKVNLNNVAKKINKKYTLDTNTK
jgi:predicted Zn-ribbon and HTH transcriptional regulator